jgi:deoxyhypusine synthase
MTNKPVTKHQMISAVHLESICAMIADTNEGLAGTEITKILADCSLTDHSPELNKRNRLYNAFVVYQNNTHCSNGILKFLSQAMNPARYFNNDDLFWRL